MPIHIARAVAMIVVLDLVFWTASVFAAEHTDEQPICKYIGNLFSLKFHRPSCKFARAMWRENIVRFQYRKQAVDAGQKPCRYCLPPDWKSVGAKILCPETSSANETSNSPANPHFLNDKETGVYAEGEKEIDQIHDEAKIHVADDKRDGIKTRALSILGTTDYQLPKERTGQRDQSPGSFLENNAGDQETGSTAGEVKQADNASVLSD